MPSYHWQARQQRAQDLASASAKAQAGQPEKKPLSQSPSAVKSRRKREKQKKKKQASAPREKSAADAATSKVRASACSLSSDPNPETNHPNPIPNHSPSERVLPGIARYGWEAPAPAPAPTPTPTPCPRCRRLRRHYPRRRPRRRRRPHRRPLHRRRRRLPAHLLHLPRSRVAGAEARCGFRCPRTQAHRRSRATRIGRTSKRMRMAPRSASAARGHTKLEPSNPRDGKSSSPTRPITPRPSFRTTSYRLGTFTAIRPATRGRTLLQAPTAPTSFCGRRRARLNYGGSIP